MDDIEKAEDIDLLKKKDELWDILSTKLFGDIEDLALILEVEHELTLRGDYE